MTQNIVIWVFFIAVGIIGFVQIFKINKIANNRRRNGGSSFSEQEKKQLRKAWIIIAVAMIAFLIIVAGTFLVKSF